MVAGGIIVDSNREGVHADFNNGKAQDFVTSCELEELFSGESGKQRRARIY